MSLLFDKSDMVDLENKFEKLLARRRQSVPRKRVGVASEASTKERFRDLRLKNNLTVIGPDGRRQIKALCIDIN